MWKESCVSSRKQNNTTQSVDLRGEFKASQDTYIESSLSRWGNYAVFNMALYMLSYELTEDWEIADHLTPTLSDQFLRWKSFQSEHITHKNQTLLY